MNFGNSKRRRAIDTQVNKISERIESESNETPSERRRRLSYKEKAHRRISKKPKQTLSRQILPRIAKHREILTDSICVPKRCLRSNTRLSEPKTPEQYSSSGHSYLEMKFAPNKSMLDLLNGTSDANLDDGILMHKIKTEPIDEVCTDDVPPDSDQYGNSVGQASSPVCDVKLESCEVFPPKSERLEGFEDNSTKPIQSALDVPIVASQVVDVQENMIKPAPSTASLQFRTSIIENFQRLLGLVKLNTVSTLRSTILKPVSSPKCAPVLKLAPLSLSLAFHGYETTEVVTVLNHQSLKKPLIVQLFDELGNPSFESGIMVQLSSMDGLQFNPLLEFAKSNEYGQANYGTPVVFTNTRKLAVKCPVEMCTNFCYGMFTVTSRAWYRDMETTGPCLRFHLQRSCPSRITHQNYPLRVTFRNCPSRLLVGTCNEKHCVAGATLKDFRLYAITNDNRLVDDVTDARFNMKIWRNDGCRDSELDVASSLDDGSYLCDGVFIVKRTAPTKAGLYCFQFSYYNGRRVLFSDVIKLNVLPGKPNKLVLPKTVGIPVVSNSRTIQNRLIVENVKVQVTDAYSNVVSVFGMLLSIKLLSQHDNCETPTFVGGIKSIEVPIGNGEVILAHILTEEHCPGIDGKQYFLRFEVTNGEIEQTNTLVHDLPFFFYHDTTKQDLLVKLTKENESLLSSFKVYKELLEISEKLFDSLQGNLLELEAEEQTSLSALRDIGICHESVNTLPKVQVLFQEKSMLLADILRTQNYVLSSEDSNKSGILGKVGDLAWVADRGIAEILSWHLTDSMECVVADTAEKAYEYLSNIEGEGDTLALDLVEQDALDIWKSNLPHVQIPHKFEPKGNPIAVREHLIFLRDVNKCTVVFGLLLGNTILMDKLEHAIEYRQKIVKHTICPTILTKDGHRIQSNGSLSMKKFSTLGNLMVFRAPPECTEQELDHAIELLKSHRLIMEQREKAQLQMADYKRISIDNDMQGKRDECLKMESRLKELKPQIDNLRTNDTGSNSVVLQEALEN